jgi:hypothetical protein
MDSSINSQRWGFAIHAADGVYGYIPVGCTDMLVYGKDKDESLPYAYNDGKMIVRYGKPDGEGNPNPVWDKLCENKYKLDNAVRSIWFSK